MGQMRFQRHGLSLGDEEIPVLVASEDGQPHAVFMSYESFLDLAATLYTAVETLRAAGVDASLLEDEQEPARPALRAIDGGKAVRRAG